MRRRSADFVDIRGACPYCEFNFSIEASSILGERHALSCIDCRETFVVEISVVITHKIRELAGVSSDAVLDRLAIAHPRKAESDGPADPDSLATESGAPVLDTLERELELEEDDGVLGTAIPVLTDVVLGGDELEEIALSEVGAKHYQDEEPDPERAGAVKLVDREGLALEQIRDGDIVARVNGPKRKLTAAELRELRELLTKTDDDLAEAAQGGETPPDLVPTPFKLCSGCVTRTFCRNREKCTREDPARAHSGINTRTTSLSSVAKPAPPSVSNDGLKYVDR